MNCKQISSECLCIRSSLHTSLFQTAVTHHLIPRLRHFRASSMMGDKTINGREKTVRATLGIGWFATRVMSVSQFFP